MFEGGFNKSYDHYLTLRGYDPSSPKPAILKRSLVDSWSEPGFHQFWRVWNPGIGHLLFRFYLLLGGNRFRLVATMLVFTLCGIAHDFAVVLIFRRPFAAFTIAFFLSGILAVVSRSLESVLHQERWPKLINALLNISCLASSIVAAVQFQTYLFP
jgi:hypothetical protein